MFGFDLAPRNLFSYLGVFALTAIRRSLATHPLRIRRHPKHFVTVGMKLECLALRSPTPGDAETIRLDCCEKYHPCFSLSSQIFQNLPFSPHLVCLLPPSLFANSPLLAHAKTFWDFC
jgi:hypothetical protein